MGKAYIGTSGWSYPHWRGIFYPSGLPESGSLAYYASRLSTVEINNSFYRLPSVENFATWHDTVPDNFIFAVKASRYVTHRKKLKDPADSMALLLERVQPLGKKLGPILFQLPPGWHRNGERLDTFLQALPRGHRYVFEFRDPSWFDPETYRALADANAAFCIYELGGTLSPMEVTADFVYIRLHGPGGPYQGKYTDEALRQWAKSIGDWNRQGKDVYCYFDNDQAGYAPENAAELLDLLRARPRVARTLTAYPPSRSD